jgi:hypothetical protein
MILESKQDTIPYKTYWKWSIDTEAILTEMRELGMVCRNTVIVGSGIKCNWYIKNSHYKDK